MKQHNSTGSPQQKAYKKSLLWRERFMIFRLQQNVSSMQVQAKMYASTSERSRHHRWTLIRIEQMHTLAECNTLQTQKTTSNQTRHRIQAGCRHIDHKKILYITVLYKSHVISYIAARQHNPHIQPAGDGSQGNIITLCMKSAYFLLVRP